MPSTPVTPPAIDVDEAVTLWGLLLEVQHQISARLWDDLATVFPYPPPFFEVLLRVAQTPGQAVPMTRLAEMVLFSSGGFTKLADRMESEGLIRRVPCPGDRRSSLVSLTPEGRRVFRVAISAHASSIDRHFAGRLSATRRGQLEAILRALRDEPRATWSPDAAE